MDADNDRSCEEKNTQKAEWKKHYNRETEIDEMAEHVDEHVMNMLEWQTIGTCQGDVVIVHGGLIRSCG